MTQIDPNIETVASLHLDGDRFKDFGMPAATAQEIAALDEILYQLIELRWRTEHPESSKLPNNFRQDFELRINTIAEGSSTPLLERMRSTPDAPTLFSASADEFTEYYRQAMEELEEILRVASEYGPLPQSVFELPPSAIRNIGSTLREDENLQVGHGRITDWSKKPVYTTVARKYLIEQLDRPLHKYVTYSGLISRTNVSKRTFSFVDAASRVSATAKYNHGFELEIDGENEQTWAWVEVTGQVEFTNNSNTHSFISVDKINTTQLTADYNRLQTRLNEIRELQSGWLDGEYGAPFASDQIDQALTVLKAAVNAGKLPHTVAPSIEGAIEFSWIDRNQHFSIEVEPEGGFYLHKSNTESMNAIDKDVDSLGKHPSDLIMEWVRRII
ncbi:hypothetical protein NLL33_02115 [Corynebacterium accolens]|uniref:hypothetical protein n=1 Tax=Corynebacterium accolens TaxID=38284 RepID=UPI00266F752C|nr:hypothetical protein [Corynebacterium accolens]WKS67240.1 hypothetical protein NLL33_02115 [Corynebacterium accolens]